MHAVFKKERKVREYSAEFLGYGKIPWVRLAPQSIGDMLRSLAPTGFCFAVKVPCLTYKQKARQKFCRASYDYL